MDDDHGFDNDDDDDDDDDDDNNSSLMTTVVDLILIVDIGKIWAILSGVIIYLYSYFQSIIEMTAHLLRSDDFINTYPSHYEDQAKSFTTRANPKERDIPEIKGQC